MAHHEHHPREPRLYGVMAMFLSPEAVVQAAHTAYAQGFRRMDAYSPMPVEGLAEAIGFKTNRMPAVVLVSGIIGAVLGYGLQYFSGVINYPINIGGRPFHSWPAFIPITFEMTILCASFGAVLGMLGLNGLPRPYHPVFNVPRFALASRSRFFLCILADDPLFDPDGTTKFLEGLNPREVSRVEG
jgi:hypothetical protein